MSSDKNGSLQSTDLNTKTTEYSSAEKKQSMALNDYLKLYEPEICQVLPDQVNSASYISICNKVLNSNSDLKDCTPESFIGSILRSATLGLVPNTSTGSYLVPHYSNGKKECMFQLSYWKLIQLAYNSGKISRVTAETVYEKDEFKYCRGLNPDLIHIPYNETDRGKPVAYYAYYKTKDGDFDFVVAYKYEMEDFRDNYADKDEDGNIPSSSPWNKNFDLMAKKVLIKRVLKLAPLSPSLQEYIQSDSTIKSVNLSGHNLDLENLFNMVDETNYDCESNESKSMQLH